MAGSPNILGDQSATAGVVSTVSRKKGWADLNLSLPLHPIRKDIMPLKDDDAEEQTTNSMANWLIGVFKDNPWFLDFLKENISKKIKK